MYCTRDAEVLHYPLTCYVCASGTKLLGEARFNQRHPCGHSLHLISWSEHSTVGALYEFASALSTFTAPTGSSFLRHLPFVLETLARASVIKGLVEPLILECPERRGKALTVLEDANALVKGWLGLSLEHDITCT